MTEVKLGFYRHFKGGIYEVIGVASNTDSVTPMVVYKDIQEKKLWVRALSSWSKPTDDGEPRYRFLFDRTEIEKIRKALEQQ